MSQAPTTFILFEVLPIEDRAATNLPAAVLVRLSESLKDRLLSSALDVESDFFRRLEINVQPDDVRWLSLVAFDSEGGLAPVDDWFDPKRDQIIYAADSANMEYEDGAVEFAEACAVFTHEGVPSSVLTLEKYQGKMLLGAGGETTSHWNLNTATEKWETVAKALEAELDAVEDTESKHQVSVVFPSSARNDYQAGEHTQELRDAIQTFEFATTAEGDAFLQGVSSAVGWGDYEVLTKEEVELIQQVAAPAPRPGA